MTTRPMLAGLAMAGLCAAPTLVSSLWVSVEPVSAQVAAPTAVSTAAVPGQPAVEVAQRQPIQPLPSPCTTQARRLAETHEALEADHGPTSLIEAADAALIAKVLIEQCQWTPVETVLGKV